jgi:S1-C subfamily serine protease/antitoxin component YwqK of YwqJK toxin-antitoxin module
MKKIAILFVLMTHLIGNSQTEKVYYNSNWNLTNSNDFEYYLEIDKSNISKEYKTFYKTGEVKSTFFCSEINTEEISKSQFYSTYIEYAKDGTPLCVGEFDNGKKVGKWNYYFDSKKLKSEIHYANDELNGKTINYIENGNIKSEGDYSNGNKTGKWTYYFDNSDVSYQETYLDGKLNGDYISYYDTKKVFEKGVFTDGFKEDNWLTNYYDGGVKSIIEYKKGNQLPSCHQCNEYKKCKIVVTNNFLKSEIQSNWTASDSTYYKKGKEGLITCFLKESKKENFNIDLNIPWKNYDDFSFEVSFKNTDNSKLQYGLSWNENEVENTSNQFLVSNEGTYSVDNLEDNVYLGNKFEKSTLINTEKDSENTLKVIKKEDSIYYSINGGLVETQKLKELEGSTFKIIVLNNEKGIEPSIIIKNYVFKDTESYDTVENGIETGVFNWSGSGTGFYVNNEGYIATNYHVIDDVTNIWVLCKQNGLKQKFKATVFQTDKINDVAIIKITDSSFVPMPPLPYQFASETIAVGNEVFSLGYPLADIMGENVKYTDGKISSLTGINEDVTKYQVTAPIQNGNSGGPLFDNSGNVIGIIESRLNKNKYASENVNYAVKSGLIKNIVDLVPTNKKKAKNIKTKSMTQVEKIHVFSDYVVMIQTN